VGIQKKPTSEKSGDGKPRVLERLPGSLAYLMIKRGSKMSKDIVFYGRELGRWFN
jgi:hypothetical protein